MPPTRSSTSRPAELCHLYTVPVPEESKGREPSKHKPTYTVERIKPQFPPPPPAQPEAVVVPDGPAPWMVEPTGPPEPARPRTPPPVVWERKVEVEVEDMQGLTDLAEPIVKRVNAMELDEETQLRCVPTCHRRSCCLVFPHVV